MEFNKKLKKIISKIELLSLNDNNDIDPIKWRQRFVLFVRMLENAEIEGNLNLVDDRVPNVYDLIELYKKTKDKNIEFYLSFIPGMNMKDLNNQSINVINQHEYILMQYEMFNDIIEKNKNFKGIIKIINNNESEIYYDDIKCVYVIDYLNNCSVFNNFSDLKSFMNILERDEIVDGNVLKFEDILIL